MLGLLNEINMCRAIEANAANTLTLFLLLIDKGIVTDAEFVAAHERAVVMVKEELTKGATNDAKTVE